MGVMRLLKACKHNKVGSSLRNFACLKMDPHNCMFIIIAFCAFLLPIRQFQVLIPSLTSSFAHPSARLLLLIGRTAIEGRGLRSPVGAGRTEHDDWTTWRRECRFSFQVAWLKTSAGNPGRPSLHSVHWILSDFQ